MLMPFKKLMAIFQVSASVKQPSQRLNKHNDQELLLIMLSKLIFRFGRIYRTPPVQYNYNLDQNPNFADHIQRAKELKESEFKERGVNRRKRRLYDKPLHDTNIQNYAAWRVYETSLKKLEEHSLPVFKIKVSPKSLKHSFGIGKLATRNLTTATYEYDFQDSSLSLFLLYDYKQTIKYWGENIEGYNYQDQQKIQPRKRKYKRPRVQQFWQKEQEAIFRINCSRYAQIYKFREYILKEIQKRKESKSMDQLGEQKWRQIKDQDVSAGVVVQRKGGQVQLSEYPGQQYRRK